MGSGLTLAMRILGYEDDEVADVLGVGEGTVRSHLAHARRKIAKHLYSHVAGVTGDLQPVPANVHQVLASPLFEVRPSPLTCHPMAFTVSGRVGDRHLRQARSTWAAKAQERFDAELFGLPITAEFKPLPAHEEVARLARKYRGVSNKRDWYVDVTELPLPYAILLCQRENLQWDWSLRRTWAGALSIALGVWVAMGLVVALIFDWSTRELLIRWLCPSLPGLLLAATLLVANRMIARDKQQLAVEIDELLGVLPAVSIGSPLPKVEFDSLLKQCRGLQDRCLDYVHPRREVPAFIYRRRGERTSRQLVLRHRG